MSTENNNQTSNMLAIENALRQKRIDALDRLARQAWAIRDEDAMIRFRYEWLAATEVMEKPLEALRDHVEGMSASDREWEEIREVQRQLYEEDQKRLYEQEGV